MASLLGAAIVGDEQTTAARHLDLQHLTRSNFPTQQLCQPPQWLRTLPGARKSSLLSANVCFHPFHIFHIANTTNRSGEREQNPRTTLVCYFVTLWRRGPVATRSESAETPLGPGADTAPAAAKANTTDTATKDLFVA